MTGSEPGGQGDGMRSLGMLAVCVGVLLMTGFDGSTQHSIGLGFWWFGAVLLVDVLLGNDGLPAQLLWAVGFGGGTAVFLSDGGWDWLTEGDGRLLVAVVTLVLAVALLVTGRSHEQRAAR